MISGTAILTAIALVADLTLIEAVMDIVSDWTSYSFLAIWVVLYFCTGSPRILPCSQALKTSGHPDRAG